MGKGKLTTASLKATQHVCFHTQAEQWPQWRSEGDRTPAISDRDPQQSR